MMLFLLYEVARYLSGSIESLWVHPHVLRQFALGSQEFDIGTIVLELTSGTLLRVLLTTERSKAPVLGDNDLLATREPIK